MIRRPPRSTLFPYTTLFRSHMYKVMLLGRIADIKAVQFQRQGRMLTFAPNMGQEAAQIGPMAAIEKTDWLVTAFREFNAMLYHRSEERRVGKECRSGWSW